MNYNHLNKSRPVDMIISLGTGLLDRKEKNPDALLNWIERMVELATETETTHR